MSRVLVLGAGASGYAAAITAAHMGAEVVLVNAEPKTARKVLASGNGRCNLGNRSIAVEQYQTQDTERLQLLLQDSALVETFWHDVGVLVRADAEGRLYPASNRAQSVADALRLAADSAGVRTEIATVTGIRVGTPHKVLTTEGSLSADRVIVALGNVAQPALGATDRGLAIARDIGLPLVPLRPSLVPLATVRRYPSLKGCRAWVRLTLEGEGVRRTEEGEVLFADYGLSGIAVMQLSAFLSHRDKIYMDLFPSLEVSALCRTLGERARSGRYPTVDKLFVGLLDRPIAYALLKEAGVSPLDLPTAKLTSADLDRVVAVAKGWCFDVEGTMGYDAAQVASGGVRLCALDEHLQCLSPRGIYFVGEVVDVTGLCGGYNLHWAWLSGIIAGAHAGLAHSLDK